jgi:hypothetical protein
MVGLSETGTSRSMPRCGLFVVVPDVAAKDSFEVTLAHHEQPVETFCPHRSHPTLRVSVGPRRSNRCLDDPDALRAEHLVEAGAELGIAVPDKELDRSTAVGEITDQVAGHLGDEGTGRVVGDTEEVHLTGRKLDHEEHVELLQRHGVHREEVRGQHALCLSGQELSPGRAAPWSRSETVLAQDPPHRAGRDADPELSQLALDADTAPAPVLPTQTNDEVDELVTHRRSARTSLSSPAPPLVLGRFPVPSQHGLGGDQEGPPPGSREQTAERGEDGSVRRSVPHSRLQLALKDINLVPEHHDLDVLVRLGPTC